MDMKIEAFDKLDENKAAKGIAQRADTIKAIRSLHRKRRFAMKVQQKIDRALESFIRINFTEWNPNATEAAREKNNQEVREIIKRIRGGEEHPVAEEVDMADRARAPSDMRRKDNQTAMEKLAMTLPVFSWVKAVRGAGERGLATIVGEAGDLSSYSDPAKLWKRLGFAPYDGFAGSTWKREKWRPRALTKEEWKGNPFNGERYAMMAQLALWLVNAQWVGAKKVAQQEGLEEIGEGKPNGPYGEHYARRREVTKKSHPDWTDGHRRKDALRYAFKIFLKDLWVEWTKDERDARPKNRKRSAQYHRAYIRECKREREEQRLAK